MMNAKRMLAICTIAIMLTIGSGFRSNEASASEVLLKGDFYGDSASADSEADNTEAAAAVAAGSRSGDTRAEAAPFLSMLGAGSEEEVWDALYNGGSLASIAAANGKDVGELIDSQAAELSEQLRQRLLAGSITLEQYKAQRAEVYSLVASSAYGLH